MMTFSQKLVVLRKIKHLTQDEFASAVGVSRQAVYKWESGQSYPEALKLVEMKLLFGISIDDLLDDTFEIELPKKKRRRRKPKAENAEAVAEEVAVTEAAPATAETAPATEEAAPIVTEAPAIEAEPIAEAPAAEEAAPAFETEPVVEAPVVEEAPVAETAPAAEEAAPVEEEKEPATPEFKFKTDFSDIKGPAPKEINDPTANFAKRGGLFGKIFGKK